MKIQAICYNDPAIVPPVVNGARLLAGAGYRLEFLIRLSGNSQHVAYPENVRVEGVDGQGRKSQSEYIRFVQKAFQFGSPTTSIFWAHDMHGFLPAFVLARRYKRPLIYQIHELTTSNDALAIGGKLVFQFQRFFGRHADIVIVPDAGRANIIHSQLRLNALPLVVANSPLPPLRGKGELLATTLQQRGLNFEKIVFRQGSLGPGHAIEPTIRSMPMWLSENWGFVIMGRIENAYAQSLKRLAEETGVANRFVILPPVSYDDIFCYTGGADIGHAVYSPVNDNNRFSTTASNKLMEYMAAGLPLLVSDRPGLRELMATHKCGLTTDDSSPQDIAMTINKLLENSEYTRQLTEAGLDAFHSKFSYDKQFQPVLNAIQQLAK